MGYYSCHSFPLEFLKKFQQMEKMMGSLMGMFQGKMPGMPGGAAPKGFRAPPAENDGPKKAKNKRGPWGKGYF